MVSTYIFHAVENSLIPSSSSYLLSTVYGLHKYTIKTKNISYCLKYPYSALQLFKGSFLEDVNQKFLHKDREAI